MTILTAEDVDVSLDRTPILHNISFRVEEGTWVGILGPNGSGKTTLLRSISGYLPYAGSLRLYDREVTSYSSRALARRLAFVRQNPSLSFDFTVEQLVLLGRSPHKGWLETYAPQDRRAVQEALARVALDGLADRSVLSLSGGERQRVFLAQALVQEADLLLLDEPTAHLDVHYQFEFMNRLHDLVHEGRTALAVFHDLELAARYADRLLVIDADGHLATQGPPTDVLTPTLIRTVFGMKAQVSRTSGPLRIDYHGPVRSDQIA